MKKMHQKACAMWDIAEKNYVSAVWTLHIVLKDSTHNQKCTLLWQEQEPPSSAFVEEHIPCILVLQAFRC